MNDTTHDLRVSARTAYLLASSDGDETGDGGPPYTFSGVAVAAGDILQMDDGTPVLFTEEELRNAAETQAGEPLTVDHPSDDSGRPLYPPPTDETVGKVPKAGWLDSQSAVGYEATTHDENVAEGVQAESYEVSVHPTFELGEKDPSTDAYKATNIKFRDLSVVSKGDSPSNTAEWGPNQALASYTRETDIGAELTAANGDVDDGEQGRTVGQVVQDTLRALGFDPDDRDGEVLTADEGAESSTGNGSDSGSTSMDDRDTIINALVDEHDFSEEWLEDADDDQIEHLHESLGGDDGSGDGGSSTDNADNPDGGEGSVADMTPSELADSLKDQGFVTQDDADDLVEEAQAEASKADMVEDIIAGSSEFGEEDREDLMASADKIVDREYQRVRGAGAASLPGNAGSLTAAAPGNESSDDDVDAYGTGVQEDN